MAAMMEMMMAGGMPGMGGGRGGLGALPMPPGMEAEMAALMGGGMGGGRGGRSKGGKKGSRVPKGPSLATRARKPKPGSGTGGRPTLDDLDDDVRCREAPWGPPSPWGPPPTCGLQRDGHRVGPSALSPPRPIW